MAGQNERAQAILTSENSKKIPESIFLMITTESGKPPIIRSIDDYVGKKDEVAELVAQACAKWGRENVRLCKVIPTEVKMSVGISDTNW